MLITALVLSTNLLALQTTVPCRACFVQNGQAASTAGVVTGTVHDSSGGVIPGALVIVRTAAGRESRGTAGPDGTFSVASPEGASEVVVRAAGFAEVRRSLGAQSSRIDLDIVLAPAAVSEEVTVTVTKTEQQLGDVAASVNVLDQADIRRSPAFVADDVLRRIPTFSLFRRSSSIVAHPTTQGVSLRGIGPSGVSRTLVLVDGVPVNDPFGGWVNWSRIALDSADRVEVVDGATSSLYGNYAMGGVINILSSAPAPRTLDVKAQYGSRSSPKVDAHLADVWGKLGASVDVTAFDTDGYTPVRAQERGPVDNNASVTFKNTNLRLDYDASDKLTASIRAGFFREDRSNGKHSTLDGKNTEEANDTSWNSFSGSVKYRDPQAGEMQGSVFVDRETFNSNALAVPNAVTRVTGRMTLNQAVPVKGVGGIVQWSRAFASHHILNAGFDWRWVEGESQESALDQTIGTTVTTLRRSGGTQQTLGFFVQDLFSPVDRLTITLAVRADRWKNYNGHNLETDAAGVPTANNAPSLADRKDTAVSPRVAARVRVADRLSVWGGLSRGFRAPTLNELYRQFRVGPVLTLANSNLGPERLTGAEIGVVVTPVRNTLVRLTWFDNRIKDPVANVSLPQANTQQRQNLGRTRVRGVQLDAEYRFSSEWKVVAGYLYDDAKVVEAANQNVIGKLLPQVPRNRGSVEVAYSNPRLVNASISVQGVGLQHDDDLNSRIVPGLPPGLPKYAVVEISASRRLTQNFDVFFGVQNLLDQTYYVGTGPTLAGTPRTILGGVRVSVKGR